MPAMKLSQSTNRLLQNKERKAMMSTTSTRPLWIPLMLISRRKRILILKHSKFRQSRQNEGETIDAFYTRLRLLAARCDFANEDREIKAQILQGCTSSRLRKRALRDEKLTLTQLLDAARLLEVELSDKQAQEIEGECSATAHMVISQHRHTSSRRKTDLDWDLHVDNITTKANRTLGFLRRNLKVNNIRLKEIAYKAMVRPILEYACTVRDPYREGQIQIIENVQRRSARFVLNRYKQTFKLTFTEISTL